MRSPKRYKRQVSPNHIIISSQAIMWTGGYSDWTPAEQREWDRDLEELETERAQRDLNDTLTSNVENQKRGDSKELSWLELAIDFLCLTSPILDLTERICMW